MTTIKLTQQAYICDGDYRLPHSASVVWGPYYQAAAEDDNGGLYAVVWSIDDMDAVQAGDEGSACDWANPVAVIDIDNNAEITDYKIVL